MRNRPGLDGMRALAVILVILFHLEGAHLKGGWIGVDMFFVLSGWLITSLLLRERSRQNRVNLLAFYQRRLLRLVPALLVTVAFAWAVVALVTPVHNFWVDALAAITFTYDIHIVGLHHISPLGHTWSLGVEEQFYLVWPPMLAAWLAAGRKPARLAVIALSVSVVTCLAIAYGSGAHLLAYTPLGHSFELLAGATAAIVAMPRIPQWLAAGSLVALAVVVVVASEAARWEYEGGLVLIAAPIVILVLYLSTEQLTGLGRVFASRPAVWIGRRSYGIYLYHYPLLWLVNAKVTHYATKPVIVLGSFALAAASYQWIEQPVLRRKWYGADRPDVVTASASAPVAG